MLIYPAIDLYEGKAVRLYKGNYDKMTVFGDCPADIARDFITAGATHIHVVDLEGAKDGTTPNFDVVCAIKQAADSAAKDASLGTSFVEIGGGIRDDDTVSRYLDAGIDRVILGTAAVKDAELLRRTVKAHGNRIAVGIDVRDGRVAIKGWTELTDYGLEEFCRIMQDEGVKTLICTDISRDGAMRGSNREMYQKLSETLDLDIVASGGVRDIEDVKALSALGIHAAIIGKAYYTGAIKLSDAVKAAASR